MPAARSARARTSRGRVRRPTPLPAPASPRAAWARSPAARGGTGPARRRRAPRSWGRAAGSRSTRSPAQLAGRHDETIGAGLDAREVDPLVHRVRALAGRAEDDGGNPGGLDQRGVHPVGLAVYLGPRSGHGLGGGRHGAHHVGAGIDAERRPHHPHPHLRALDPVHQRAALPLEVVRALPGLGAALERQHAAGGVARQLLPTLDQGRVHRAGPYELVPRAPVELRLQTRSGVGSVRIAASARQRSRTDWAPMLAYSSSATAVTITSPASSSDATRLAASMHAATPAFMS